MPLSITGLCVPRHRYTHILDDIEGIGPARRKALMRRFQSMENMKNASVEELAETDSMNLAAAQNVYDTLHSGPA